MRAVVNWADWDRERDPDSPPQGTFILGQGTSNFTPLVMQELEKGRTDVLQTSHLGETLGSPKGAACSSCPADIFIFLSAQQVHQQKCHGLKREMEGEAMVRKVSSQICSRQAGNWLLLTFSPMSDSPNRSHDHHLGTTCLSLFLIKQTNHGWIPSAEAPI